MKVYMKPIRMVAWFTENGVPTPIRFQMKDESRENITIKVDNIVLRDEEKVAGNKMLMYRCQSQIDNLERVYELKYEVSTCKWFLYKM